MRPQPPALRAPAWSVRSERLQELLSQLRAALSGLGALDLAGLSVSVQIAEQHRELAQRIGRTVEEIRKLNPSQYVRAGEPYHPPDQLAAVKHTVVELRRAWCERFEALFGREKTLLLGRLLKSPVPDLLGILGYGDDENAHSDMLRWLLDHRTAPHVAPAALGALVSRLEHPEEWKRRLREARTSDSMTVRREARIGHELVDVDALDRVDVILSGPDFVLAIENKVRSAEHDRQTWTYWTSLDSLPQGILRGALFLTPTGLPAACPGFRPVSYLELVAFLLEGPLVDDLEPHEEIALAGYLKTLANGLLGRELRVVTADAEGMR